jgi:hypothetical protein
MRHFFFTCTLTLCVAMSGVNSSKINMPCSGWSEEKYPFPLFWAVPVQGSESPAGIKSQRSLTASSVPPRTTTTGARVRGYRQRPLSFTPWHLQSWRIKFPCYFLFDVAGRSGDSWGWPIQIPYEGWACRINLMFWKPDRWTNLSYGW